MLFSTENEAPVPKNTNSKSGQMEIKATVGKRVLHVISCDDNSRSFRAVEEANVYYSCIAVNKEDCINRVKKHMANALSGECTRRIQPSAKAERCQ